MTVSAISAVDTALWDIRIVDLTREGKASGSIVLPVIAVRSSESPPAWERKLRSIHLGGFFALRAQNDTSLASRNAGRRSLIHQTAPLPHFGGEQLPSRWAPARVLDEELGLFLDDPGK